MELYLRSIARRWKSEISGLSAKKYVFSPYITSGTAETVLSAATGEPCEIYTLFSAELFASRASSLRTIKKLISYGHHVFLLRDLHAKIILVPGAFASIGSQNLTVNGTRNKEASVLIKCEKELLQIEKEVMRWMEERSPITVQMVDDMEVLLKSAEVEIDAFDKAIELANQTVHDNQRKRDEAALENAKELARQQKMQQEEALRLEALELKAKEEAAELQRKLEAERERQVRIHQEESKEREIRLKKLSDNMGLAQRSLSTANGVVRRVGEASDRYSLRSEDNRDLTLWTIDGKRVELTRGKRYLIMHRSGRLGWARVMKSRITFVEQSIHWSDESRLAGHVLQINVRANWSEAPQNGRNIVFEVFDCWDHLANCTISAWFDLRDLTLLKIEKPAYATLESKERDEAIERIKNGWPEIKEYCLKRIVRPFKYAHNLTGEDASTFFGGTGSWVRLSVALVEESPVLFSF